MVAGRRVESKREKRMRTRGKDMVVRDENKREE